MERILEDGLFGEAHVLAPAIVKFLECFFLLVREALFQFLVMPCHVSEEFLHLRRVRSAILLRNYVSVPQFVYHIFHRFCLLFYQHNNITQKVAEVQHLFENKSSFFRKVYSLFIAPQQDGSGNLLFFDYCVSIFER